MKIQKIKSKNYPIYIGLNSIKILSKKINIFFPQTKKIAIIVDTKVPIKKISYLKKNLKGYKLLVIKIKASEKNKSFFKVNSIIEYLIKNQFNRSDLVISVGGGIIGDTSAFIASIFKRGLNFINIPSTLLAQVDSAIGGKTGVNSKQGKNLIGSFYNPRAVIIDTSFLTTLPKKQLICGYAEILKHSLIKNKKFFQWLKINSKKILIDKNPKYIEEAIKRSCLIKLSIVDKDFKESKNRMRLNFGHTFAHAIESRSGFSQKLNHGEAVLIGMLIATKISKLLNICSKNTLDDLVDIYERNNFQFYLEKFNKKNN